MIIKHLSREHSITLIKSSTLILITLFMLLFGSCGDGRVLATYDGGKVTLSEAEADFFLLETSEREFVLESRDELFKLVRKSALEEILVQLAIEKKLDRDETFLSEYDEMIKRIGFNTLWEREVADKVTVRKADFEQYMVTYEVYQIARRTDILDDNAIESSRKLMQELAASITDIETFKTMAKQHSQDETRANGGYLGLLRPGIMVPEFDAVMTTIEPGKVSEPFETQTGIHLIMVQSISRIALDDLLTDIDLFEQIKKEKTDMREEEWYSSLLDSRSITIDYNALDAGYEDSAPVVTYRDRIITRSDIIAILDSYKNEMFPEPNRSELQSFVDKQALNLVIESLITEKSITSSKRYKQQVESETNFLLSRLYIERFAQPEPVTEDEMLTFYEEHKSDLFTFSLDNGTMYVQPYTELEDFIRSKVSEEKIRDGRFSLYRSVTENAHLKIDDSAIQFFQEYLAKI
jgi:hypothetical protein